MGVVSARAYPRLTPRGARWIAWSLWVIAVAQVVVGLLLAVLNGLSPHRLVAEFAVAVVVAALAFTAVGVLIARRQPGNAVGWLCCAAGLGNGLFAWSGQYARYSLVTRPGALPGGEVALWLNLWAWVPVEATVILFLPLLFPDGRLPSPRWRPLPWLAALAIALFAASLAFSPNTDSILPERQNPFVLSGARGALDLAGSAGSALALASLLGAVGAAVARYRRARDVERQQLKWVGFAATLLIAAYLASSTIYLSGFDRSGFTSGVLLALAFPCVPAATGIAILRYRLYDIDLLINRTLVYVALTAGVVGLYVGIVGYFGTISRSGGSLPISLAATALVAVVFQPLRAWMQRGVWA